MDKQQVTRIEHLEEALAHLTRLTDDLSDVIARQDTEIARLTRRVEMLMRAEAEREAEAGGTVPLADQRPPHW
ncbi:SlyX family protein [Paracoccus saliphilus]|uniref:SlyX family protein n=1 Tax=Paracoccus saliphilus TaxID=405559 RepID=A0AA46A6I5_9RHOB|nr:SlyX family protein [Paracoccus saliphilus]WCR01615.1 SlyX family protein [Paracoccus saliphilus]SIS98702.1 SlyX protein [Paracoccus saliphilus]